MRLFAISFFFLLPFAVSLSPAQEEAESDSCTGEISEDTTYVITVNPALPQYGVNFLIREHCCNVAVFAEGRKDTLQRFTATWGSYILDDGIEFLDANFDGYTDLRIFTGRGNSGSESFDFYLFDKKTGRFTYDSAFTDLFTESAVFYEDKQEIVTGGFRGCAHMCWEFETHRKINGEFVLVSVERQDGAGIRADGQDLYVRELQELENGQMKVIQKVTGTLEEIEKQWKDD